MMEKSLADEVDSSFSLESFKSIVDKSADADSDDRSSLNRFPDDIVLHILKKVIALKTLCICKLVTKRVSSIVVLVDNITFTTPLVNPVCCPRFQEIQKVILSNEIRYPFQSDSFKSAMKSLENFKQVKSLYIQLPSSCLRNFEDYVLMKWKLVFSHTKAAPYVFMLILNTITDSEGNKIVGEEPLDFTKQLFAQFCWGDAVTRQRMLSGFYDDFPLLEKVSISDNIKRGRISVCSGGIIRQLRNDLGNNSMDTTSWCKVALLKLPVSGYVMKGVIMFVVHRKNDEFDNIDFDGEYEDEEEVAYTEAMKEIIKKHKGKFKRAKLV